MLVQKGLELSLFTDYDDPELRLVRMRCSNGTKICDFVIDTNKVAIDKFGSKLANYNESYERQQIFDIFGKEKLKGQWFFRRIHFTVYIVTTKPYKKVCLTFFAKYYLFGLPAGKMQCDFEISSTTLRDWGLQIKEWAGVLPMPTLTLTEKPRS